MFRSSLQQKSPGRRRAPAPRPTSPQHPRPEHLPDLSLSRPVSHRLLADPRHHVWALGGHGRAQIADIAALRRQALGDPERV